jgi:hypothetical protein
MITVFKLKYGDGGLSGVLIFLTTGKKIKKNIMRPKN